MPESVEVHVGDRTYKIVEFKAFKAVEAGDMLKRVSKEVKQVLDALDTFDREYAENNKIRLTRDIAHARGYELPEGRDYIDLPASPTTERRYMEVFDQAFNLARTEVLRLLALVVIPNSELYEAEDTGTVEVTLDEIGKTLMREGTIQEMVHIAAVAVEMVRSQLFEVREDLGKLRSTVFQTTPPDGGTNETEEAQKAHAPENRIDVATVTPASPAPNSSTTSPEHTGGAETESSSASPGLSSVS